METIMKKTILTFLLISVLIAGIVAIANAQTVKVVDGAGASFPYPLYSQWAYKYNQITGVRLNYQSIGSGGGIRQIKAGTVDFGASDAPMKAEELEKSGLIQFPMVIGGVVPVVNIKGMKPGEIKIDPKTLADIFMGKITKWNDTAIAALNPGIKLPKKDITVVHRADGSGTTWIFTKYLAAVSKTWASQVGANKAVSWPVGVGGKGNEGVASYVKRINGSIGYVEFAYALQNNLTYALLKNRDGKFLAPTKDNFMAAAANADWKHAAGFYLVLVNQPGESSWPITGASFIIIYKKQSDKDRARTMLDFFDWCYQHGKETALKLDYVPMPDNVVDLVEKVWTKEVEAGGKTVWE